MCGVGIQLSSAKNRGVVELIVSKIVEGGAAEQQLAINDVIEMVDGSDVRGLPASSVAQQILGPAQTPVMLDIRRGQVTKRVVILRQHYSLSSSHVKPPDSNVRTAKPTLPHQPSSSQLRTHGADTEARSPVRPTLTRAQTMSTPVLSLPQDHVQVPSQLSTHNTGSFQVDHGAPRSQNGEQARSRPPASGVRTAKPTLSHHPSLLQLQSRQIVSTKVSALDTGLAPRGGSALEEDRPRLRAQGSVRLPSP